MNQEEIWVNGEGDNWFLRNKSSLASWHADNDIPLQLLLLFNIVPQKILEVGCTNGYRLAALSRRYGSNCYGIDPSNEAIHDGSNRYPSIHLNRGVASKLPFDPEEFDLIIVNFVFHWLSRSKLILSLCEIDRVLKWNGFLLIGDFSPASPCKVKYHHLPNRDVWTYKQNYSELFTSTMLYHLVGSVSASHKKRLIYAASESYDRIQFNLLQKQEEYQYFEL